MLLRVVANFGLVWVLIGMSTVGFSDSQADELIEINTAQDEHCYSYDHTISFPDDKIRIESKCKKLKPTDRPLPRSQRSLVDAIVFGEYSLFVEFSRIFSHVSDEDLTLDGLRLGIHDAGDDVLSFAYYKARDKPTTTQGGTAYLVDFEYGGFVLNGIGDVDRITDIYFGCLVGAGRLTLETSTDRFHSPTLLVLEPEIGFNLQVSRWVQASLALTYRWVNGFEEQGISGRDLRSTNVAVRFRFGKFYPQ